MKTIGIFEAKTRLAEICQQVALNREPITVTRRGEPLVRIDPIDNGPQTIRERRDAYMAEYGKQQDHSNPDFSVPPRSQDAVHFVIEDSE
jgi:prevent-host-death family protein